MSEVASARAPALSPRSRFSDALSLAKPGITLLIVLVAVGGYFLANPAAIDWYRLLLLVLTGAAAAAGAGGVGQ